MSLTTNKVILDLRVEATGVHAAGTTTWTTTCPCYADRAVVLATGVIVTITKTSDTTFTASGNYAGAAVLGCIADFDVPLTQVFPRDQAGNVIHDQAIIGTMTVLHETATGYNVEISHESGGARPTETYTWSSDLTATEAHQYGRLTFNAATRAEECTIRITEVTYKPIRIVGIEYELHIQEGLR